MTTEKAWLKERRKRLQASEVAAVLGYDTRFGPLAVWASKVNGYEIETNRAMRRGHFMEPFIAREYELDTGRPVRDLGDYEIVKHPDVPFLGATLDRITDSSRDCPAPRDGEGPLELKTVNTFGSKSDWAQNSPVSYQVQLQTQISCLGAKWGSLCGLTSGADLPWADFELDEELMRAIMPHLEKFWWHVKKQVPPKDTSPKSLIVAKRTWADGDGSTLTWDSQEIADLVDRWESAKLERNRHKKEVDSLESQIRQHLGPASFGALADGTIVSKELRKRKGYTVEPKEFTVLTRKRPKGE
jgi:putative phage-type endonuclease